MKASKKKQDLIALEITTALKTIRQNGTSKVLPSFSNLTDSELESVANYLTGWIDSVLHKSKKRNQKERLPMENVSKEFLMYQREKSGEGLVIRGNFYEWEFYGQTEEELIESVKGKN